MSSHHFHRNERMNAFVLLVVVIYDTFSEISLVVQKHINLSDIPFCYLGALRILVTIYWPIKRFP